jgi:hypothetical protein
MRTFKNSHGTPYTTIKKYNTEVAFFNRQDTIVLFKFSFVQYY